MGGFGSLESARQLRLQPFLDEGITPWEPHDQVFVVDIVHRDVQVFEPLEQRCVITEVPVQYRNDMGDSTVS